MMPLRQNRVLVQAVLLSLALHAFILFGQLPSVRRAQHSVAPPAPLVARLAEPEPPVSEKVEPEKKPEPQRPAPPPKPREREADKASPVVAEAAPPEPPAAVAQAAPQDAPQAAPQAAAPSASAHARAAATEGAVAQTIAQYRLQVIGAAREFKGKYPALARENNWEGMVEVRMKVNGDGALGALDVEKSSGHEVLDEQALDMFRRAQAHVPLPAALRGRDFTIRMRASYSLKDADQ